MQASRNLGAWLGLAIVALFTTHSVAEVTLPSLFSDHMVLQRETEVPIWGWAEPGEEICVTIGDQQHTCTTGPSGVWQVEICGLPAGGPHTLTVKGNNTIEIKNLLVGEVWLCSGQSNMAMTVSRAKDFPQEQAAATCSAIRMFTVDRKTAVTPQDRCHGAWTVCSPETVGSFSATAYFFGRTLQQELNVPVGLINSSWGGTPIQAWTSVEAQQAHEELVPTLSNSEKQIAQYDPAAAEERYEKQLNAWKAKAQRAKQQGSTPPRRPRAPVDPTTSPRRPGNLFNGMIAPLAPYAIRGAIWYQGEANARDDAPLYGLRLTTMIDQWRQLWDQGDFPFLWVQLPNFRAAQTEPVETSPWVLVQEQMLRAVSHKNTGVAVTIDVGEANDIHPKNKQDVGKRLAFWALGATYGRDNTWCGPLYKSHHIRDGQVIIEFEHVGDGLVVRGDQLEGFAIAGDEGSFVWADAQVVDDTVVISSGDVEDPVAVRYAWAQNPKGNLYNKAGLPASPFRTDFEK
jgi:sialate O-acetylesterase